MVLLEEAEKLAEGCILMGSTGRSAFDRFLIGSVSGLNSSLITGEAYGRITGTARRTFVVCARLSRTRYERATQVS